VTRSVAWPAVLALLAGALAGCGDNSAPPDAPPDAVPDEPQGVPDLQFVAEAMTGTVALDFVDFATDNCAVVEHCVGAAGRRRLLKFATVTANLGSGDLIVGVPPPPGVSNDVFVWSPCHQHHHVVNYALYELIDSAGNVTAGRKQAFCLEDDERVLLGAQTHHYSCKDQGISRGFADVYANSLACQWMDITGMASGDYTLRITVNPLHTIVESDTSNDVFTVGVTF
jgi:hypothetical protein